jgi:hypothetical protein
MLISYLDESSTTGYYFIGALVLSPQDVSAVSDVIENISSLIVQDHPLIFDQSDELRGSQIWNGKGKWKNIGDRYRYSVFIRAFEQLAELDIEIALQGINKKRLENQYLYPLPPHELALKYLLDQLDKKFISQSSKGLIICDETGSRAEDNKHRALLREWRAMGTGGPFPRNLTSIADTLHFVPSQESRLVQAIDLITFLHQRRTVTRYPESLEYEVMSHLWSKIEGKVIVNRIV